MMMINPYGPRWGIGLQRGRGWHAKWEKRRKKSADRLIKEENTCNLKVGDLSKAMGSSY